MLDLFHGVGETESIAHGIETGKEHRFVWVQNGEKVGETTFRADWVPREAAGSEPATQRDCVIQATRRYDRDNISQRSRSTTTLLSGGNTIKFEEALEVASVGSATDFRSHQTTRVQVMGGKAQVTFAQNGREQPLKEHSVPAGTYLYASQAVEHWIIFLSKLPFGFEKESVKLFYPDFGTVLDVTFEKKGAEKLQVGGKAAETVRYAFQSADRSLKGTVWLEKPGRLLQIEFPSASKELTPLRVTLAAP